MHKHKANMADKNRIPTFVRKAGFWQRKT